MYVLLIVIKRAAARLQRTASEEHGHHKLHIFFKYIFALALLDNFTLKNVYPSPSYSQRCWCYCFYLA